MFTGLIENIGIVKKAVRRGNYLELTIAPEEMFEDVTLGESIAVSGPCLTVVGFDKGSFTVEASQETLALTTLADIKAGHQVNLERALRADARLGGHIVSGHIDAVLKISRIMEIGRSLRLEIELPPEFARFVVTKGSVALDGVSLTVTDVNDKNFGVNLIPETQKSTTLYSRKEGDYLNVEFDVMGKYVLRYLELTGAKEKLTFEKLHKWGY